MEVDAEALAEGFSVAFLGVLATDFADGVEAEDDAVEAFGDEAAEAEAESLYFFN